MVQPPGAPEKQTATAESDWWRSGTSADLNTRDQITLRLLGETNPVVNMVPGAWPAPTSTPLRQATSSGESSLIIDPAAPISSTPNQPVS